MPSRKNENPENHRENSTTFRENFFASLQQLSKKTREFLTAANVALLVAGLLALGLAISTASVISRNYSLTRDLAGRQLANDLLRLQNDNFRLEQGYFQTDEYLELAARISLGKALPGEHLVILPGTSENSSANSPDTTNTAPADSSNWQKWWDFLHGAD